MFYVKKVERSFKYIDHFIDWDIGYDLYCTRWDMLEKDAQCGHAHLSKLFDTVIVYCKDKSALKRLDEIRGKAALSLQWIFYGIAECIAEDDFEIMDKFSPKNLEENVDVFDQALIKYLAEYEKVGICPKHFESMTNPEYCGQGYATEAGNALVRYLFESVGISTIYGDCDVRNVSSWKLLERLGFNRIRRLDNQSYKNDKNGNPILISTFLYELDKAGESCSSKGK